MKLILENAEDINSFVKSYKPTEENVVEVIIKGNLFYSMAKYVEGSITQVKIENDKLREQIKEEVPVKDFDLLAYYSDVREDLEGISEFKSLTELRKELDSIPYKYAMADSVFLFDEVEKNYPSIHSLAEASESYVPELLGKLAKEFSFLEELNEAPFESITEETYYSIEDYYKEKSSVNAVEEEPVGVGSK